MVVDKRVGIGEVTVCDMGWEYDRLLEIETLLFYDLYTREE